MYILWNMCFKKNLRSILFLALEELMFAANLEGTIMNCYKYYTKIGAKPVHTGISANMYRNFIIIK